MSEPSRQPIAGPVRAASLSTLLIIAASWAIAAQTASGSDSTKVAELERRLSQMEDRLSTGSGGATRIKGPLEVVDASGQVVLKLGFNSKKDGQIIANRSDGTKGAVVDGAGSFKAFNHVEGEVATMGFSKGAGKLALSDALGNEMASLGETENAGTLKLAQSLTALKSVQLGPGKNGNTALRIYNSDGTAVAVLGVDPGRDDTGTLLVSNSKGGVSAAVMGGERGAVVVADGSGSTVTQMSVSEEGRGIFQVFHGGVSVAALTKGATGGMLQIASDGGVPMVEAGVMANGRGTVRAGPNYKCVPAQGTLNVMFPDCLVGRD
jgi:hypothetical protein